MTVWKFLGIVTAGVGLLAMGLAVAYQWSLEWLRVVTPAVVIPGVAVAVMLVKRRGQRQSRSMEADSVERARDGRARAAAFVDVVVAAAVGVAVGVLFPQLAGWVVALMMLVVAVGSYVVRRAVEGRRDGAHSE